MPFLRPVTRLGMLACLLLLGLLAALAVPWMYARAAIPKPPSAERLSAATRQQVGAAYVVARWRPRSAERVGGLARIYHANLFHAEAERCYELAERLASQDYRWPYLRAVLAETRSAQDVALTLLMKVVSLRSDYAAAWVRLGNIQFKGNRLPEAAAAYEQARQVSPQDPHARLGLARVALGRGATDEARGVL
ncbi:MAG: tetratricopeptide repeat protein, partial [Planctomycetes bacterium]|nr:tetratricopeptide repeat protein [Planctomycetota bacterium]